MTDMQKIEELMQSYVQELGLDVVALYKKIPMEGL